VCLHRAACLPPRAAALRRVAPSSRGASRATAAAALTTFTSRPQRAPVKTIGTLLLAKMQKNASEELRRQFTSPSRA